MKGGTAPPARSLKGRALQWLSQREHSRSEMRRKLLTHARAQAALTQARLRTTADLPAGTCHEAQADGWNLPPEHVAELGAGCSDAAADGEDHGEGADDDGHRALANLQAQVDAVLDWLAAHRYLSEERFAESRVHARAGRFGNLRIRRELAQHGLALAPEAAQSLKETELTRARAVWERKFSAGPAGVSERARQQRFLAGRGFSPEVIHQLLRSLPGPAGDDRDAADPDA